jgi:hypothetical protein
MAAEAVELFRFTPEKIGQAISAWRLAEPAGIDAAAVVGQWWQIYLETRPTWSVALTALDRMLP